MIERLKITLRNVATVLVAFCTIGLLQSLSAQTEPQDSSGKNAETSAVKTFTKDDFQKSECNNFFEFKSAPPSIEISRMQMSRDQMVKKEQRLHTTFDITFVDPTGREHKMKNIKHLIRETKDNSKMFGYFWKHKDDRNLEDLLIEAKPVVKGYGRTEAAPEIYICTTFYRNKNEMGKEDARDTSFVLHIKLGDRKAPRKELKDGVF